ncbi:MAG: hypothetical protein PVJ86_04470, partial [Phycisphaerales bacterium]
MKRKHRHIRHRFKIWHGIAALLLLLFVLFRISGSYKLKRRVQALQSRGHPVTLEELERSYSLPQGVHNAADVYLAAFSNYKKWDADTMRALPVAGRASLPARTEPLDVSTRQLAGRFLSDNQQTLSLLREAASIKHCRYPGDFAQESDPKASWRDDLRASAQLLGLEALIASEDKDTDKFLDSIRTSLALARSVDGPMLIHRLMHVSVRGITYRSIERAINRIPLTDEQLLMLSALVKESDKDEGFKKALLAEQCLGLHTFIAPLKEVSNRFGEQESGLLWVFILSRILGLNSRYALSYINLMQESVDALELPDPDRLETFNTIQENVNNGKQGGVVIHLLWPALARMLHIDVSRQAQARVTRAGLAVERYRLAEGHLPQSLDNLAPAYMQIVPEDPFNGEELRYRRLKTGFVVYSVSEDLSDNGGTERNTKKRDPSGKPLPWDITFIVE